MSDETNRVASANGPVQRARRNVLLVLINATNFQNQIGGLTGAFGSRLSVQSVVENMTGNMKPWISR
ncbi:MAG: hypothetical protein CMJ62_10330 [Planctomycetaceae bacterium]|nr:hypothetical protein [Planctomycetaceae bacterium]